MNFAIDLKSITDGESERSSIDFESYDSASCSNENVKVEEDEVLEDDEKDGSDEDKNEDDVCEFATRLRENLKCCEMSQINNCDSHLYDDESIFDLLSDGFHRNRSNGGSRRFKSDDGDSRMFREGRNDHDGDLVCFYLNSVTESSDLIKYFRPKDQNLKCKCWVCERVSSTMTRFQEDRRSVLTCVQCDCVSGRQYAFRRCPSELSTPTSNNFRFPATSGKIEDDRIRRFYFRRRLISSVAEMRRDFCRCSHLDGVDEEVVTLKVCVCSTSQGCSGGKEGVIDSSPRRLENCAASLASAAQSARNLARDLDQLMNTLSTQENL